MLTLFVLLIGLSPAGTAQEQLQKARALYDDLEFDQVIPLTKQILEREDLAPEQQLDAYLLLGTCLAIVGDELGAEGPFRFLLRGRPDYELAKNAPPRAVGVFNKVKMEEMRFRAKMAELQHQRIIESLQLFGTPPTEWKGGEPVLFEYRLRDPRGVVDRVSVNYRRQSQPSFSSLALDRRADGVWTGKIPGEWTADANGFTLQYFVSTLDQEGKELLTVATSARPLELSVTSGELAVSVPFYQTAWFWALAAGVVVASGVAGYVAVQESRSIPETGQGEFHVD